MLLIEGHASFLMSLLRKSVMLCIKSMAGGGGCQQHFKKWARTEQSFASCREQGDIETGDAGVECVICMNPLDVQRLPARMVTPCGHVFHNKCLHKWMDVKMECPTCRQPLPPP